VKFSAWIQISEGRETVSVIFKTTDELVRGGKVIAEHGCWSLLKGGIVANFSTAVEILFEVNYFSFFWFFFPNLNFSLFYKAFFGTEIPPCFHFHQCRARKQKWKSGWIMYHYSHSLRSNGKPTKT
jgi:hypothetical protein